MADTAPRAVITDQGMAKASRPSPVQQAGLLIINLFLSVIELVSIGNCIAVQSAVEFFIGSNLQCKMENIGGKGWLARL